MPQRQMKYDPDLNDYLSEWDQRALRSGKGPYYDRAVKRYRKYRMAAQQAYRRRNREAKQAQEAAKQREIDLRRDAQRFKRGDQSDAKDLIKALMSGTSSANRANELRYRRMLAMLGGLGATRSADIDRSVRTRQASTRQSLINRGLGNATVLEPIASRIAESGQRAKNDLFEGITGRKVNLMMSRTDSSPAIGPALQYLYKYGSMR